MRKRVSSAAIFVVISLVSLPASALQMITGRVLTIEATYMPVAVQLAVDSGNAACPTGTWLKWKKADLENNKAVYAMLLAAQASGKKVNFFINDNDTKCEGQFIHLISQ